MAANLIGQFNCCSFEELSCFRVSHKRRDHFTSIQYAFEFFKKNANRESDICCKSDAQSVCL